MPPMLSVTWCTPPSQPPRTSALSGEAYVAFSDFVRSSMTAVGRLLSLGMTLASRSVSENPPRAGSDPQQPDDVCKCYGSLPIFKPPFAQILGQPAAVPLLPLVRHLIFCLSTSFDAQVARSAANGGLSTQALVLS